MNFHDMYRTLGAFGLGAALLVTTGCAETALVGQLDDSELQDIEVLPLAGLGVSREINDLIYANLDMYLAGGYTDEVAYGGVSGAESNTAIGNAPGNQESGGFSNAPFEQIHEAVWASYKVVSLARNLMGDSDDFMNSPIVARAWMDAGWMERVMADTYCEATYQYGPFGGFNLGPLEAWQQGELGNVDNFDPGTPLQKDSIYQKAVFDFQQAIAWAERAIASGAEIPDEDPGYYDPDSIRISAYGGLAQAHHALASYGVNPTENWAAAVAAAANVPTDFRHEWATQVDLRSNQNWSLSWANDDLSHWADTIEGTIWGAAFTRHVEPGDVRGGVQVCQDFGTKTGGEAVIFTRPNVINTGNAGCTSEFRSINTDMELRELPRWLMDSLKERFHQVPALEGTDARLIEAEVALRNGDLATFTSKINEVRTFYGASTISQPATAGALEYPNEVDDGWSILDREWLLDDFSDLRRMFHLDRLNHPFVTENHTTHPAWRDLLAEQGAGFQRWSCLPIPSNECNLNQALDCPEFGN